MSIILFELNEVPWRVMDWYCERHPTSAFARMCRDGGQFETVTEERGDLHPWVTWPSLHRGVSDNDHGISHLGQDLKEVDQVFPTLWTHLATNGLSVGVAGSMQSYPIPAKTEKIRFFIPDTYAPTSETIPFSLSAFQDVNLRLTKENSRNVASRTSSSTSMDLVRSLPAAGMTIRTALGIGTQLVREKTDKTKLNRRRAIQSSLYFDAFMKQLQSERPHFSTFFTNHVAASMHRFWAATFPGDYARFDLPQSWVNSYAGELEWAMTLADGFAARLIRFCERNPDYSIVLCSSMGQAATTARIREGIYTLKRVDRFMGALGVAPEAYREAMAMAPHVSVHLLTDHAKGRVRAAMTDMKRAMPKLEWDIDERGMLHIGFALKPDPDTPMPEFVIGNTRYAFDDLGIEFVPDQDRVATTAYHIPEGILISWSPIAKRAAENGRQSVSSLEVAPAVIAAFGLDTPAYMKKTAIALK